MFYQIEITFDSELYEASRNIFSKIKRKIKRTIRRKINFRGSKTAAGTTLLFSSLAFRNALKTQSNM